MKGNRQGVLSRSITRPQATKLQNNISKIYFAILKAACQKCPEDFFDKLEKIFFAGKMWESLGKKLQKTLAFQGKGCYNRVNL